MLPKFQRLNLSKDFKFVSSGRRFETDSLVVFSKPGKNSWPLIGVALSGKYFRKAHERNRAKRLAFAAVGELYPSLRANLNLVIMPKAKILQQSVEVLERELDGIKDLYHGD